jgi:hypothetical protein
MIFTLGGSAAYAIATTTVSHTGSIPTVGSTSSSSGGFGGGGGRSPTGGVGGNGTGGRTETDSATGDSDPTSSADLDALLQATTSRWAAAVGGSQSAASLELSSGTAVMAIGGWSGDPTPTLAEFQGYVAAGDITYYVSGSQGGRGGRSDNATQIASWVEATFTAITVDGSTVYDLSGYTG